MAPDSLIDLSHSIEHGMVTYRGLPAPLICDSSNIDDTGDGRRPVHTTLLRNEIPIVEHMTGLHQLPAGGFQFFAVPPKVRAFGTFPVRAFAHVSQTREA